MAGNGVVADQDSKGRLRSTLALPDSNPPNKPKRNKFAFACAFLVSLTTIILGYDMGVMSGAIMFIKKDFDITDVEIQVLVGIINFYSIIGSLLAGKTSDWIGRRYTIMLADAIFFAAALLMAFATNYAFLMVGRFVAGIGVGYALTIAPVYIAEVSPPASRGYLTSFPEVFINTGILLGYVSNYAFSKLPTNLGWRFMLGLGALPSVVLAAGILVMPESPRWLVMQGRLREAEQVLAKTSDSPAEASLRLADIKSAVGISPESAAETVPVPKRSHGQGVWKELLIYPSPTVRHILLAGLGICFFQQSSGIAAVVLYSPTIFEKAGIKSSNGKLLATIALGFVKTISILIATFLIDRIGRRRLLLSSVAGMIVPLTILATTLTITDKSEEKIKWGIVLSIAMVLLIGSAYSIGLGPIMCVYNSEIFPLRLRAQGTSLGMVVNRVTSGVVTMTFLSLTKGVTIGGAFFMFAGIGMVGWLFVYSFLPETQGRTLEEMGVLFGGFFRLDYGKAEKNVENKIEGC